MTVYLNNHRFRIESAPSPAGRFQSDNGGPQHYARIVLLLRQLALLAVLFALLPACAQAQLTLSAGVEHFRWEEKTTPTVTEEGPMAAIHIEYLQQSENKFVLGYRGKLWTGTADYTGSTLFTNQPITGTTGYFGLANEALGRWRTEPRNSSYRVNVVTSFGIEAWRRELSSIQREDYAVMYARAGIEIDPISDGAWLFGLGIKYPIWVREDAHLVSIGFDRNPELTPEGRGSIFAHVGYRLNQQWSIASYVDGYRLSRSDEVQVTEVRQGFGTINVFQPASTMLVIGIRLERHLH